MPEIALAKITPAAPLDQACVSRAASPPGSVLQ